MKICKILNCQLAAGVKAYACLPRGEGGGYYRKRRRVKGIYVESKGRERESWKEKVCLGVRAYAYLLRGEVRIEIGGRGRNMKRKVEGRAYACLLLIDGVGLRLREEKGRGSFVKKEGKGRKGRRGYIGGGQGIRLVVKGTALRG